MSPLRLYIHGASGRIGQEVARLADVAGLQRAADAESADAWVLAVPRQVAAQWLATAGDRTVVDMSGALKARGGRYGLMHPTKPTLLRDGPPQRGQQLGNPGCIAGAVIRGLLDSRVSERSPGPLHIAATISASGASDSDGVMRLGRLGLAHPHVAEIEAASGVTVASFVATIAYGVERGVMVAVSGELPDTAPTPPLRSPEEQDLDVRQLLGTSQVSHRLRLRDRGFTLVAAADNLTFPAANAVALLMAL